ncbi:MAG TPA: hypothetical protein VJ506_09690 [Candidatus Limnocylindrales bacterium]|nr:hypothetical protein [Candidatus Limnocylindrales bacterium]
MAKALAPGRAHHRALFGFLDADGWGWAGVKAAVWLIIIILLLGYIPDRAYYFTVGKTIDLGIMFWSPVNLCPAENGGLPCPPPGGAVEPWQLSPSQLDLPEARTGGALAQLGSNVVYAGGSDGANATSTTFASKLANGSFGAWGAGPAMPEARTDAGLAVLNGTAYLIGGAGADGKPTTTVWSLAADPQSGALGAWTPVQAVTLPEARMGAAVVALSDGILVAGGAGPDGKPTATVWKSTVDSKGNLGAFQPQANLVDPVTDAGAAFVGTFVWVYGGSDANGPTGAVQRGTYGAAAAPATIGGSGAGASGAPASTPAASAAPVQAVQQWAVANAVNAPPRTMATAFSANGALYLLGGDDGHGPQRQLYWAEPDAQGNIPNGWLHLDVTDLGGGLKGAAPLVSGSSVFVVGGTTTQGPIKSSVRASLAPQPPFFQLGIAGATVPALEIPGEIGQQLGYLAAAGAGTLNFVILIVIGWALAHKPLIRGWWDRRRGRPAL